MLTSYKRKTREPSKGA